MSEHRSFWSTVPGVLTGVAALVTALGGILGFLVKQDVIGAAANEPQPPASTTTTVRGDSPASRTGEGGANRTSRPPATPEASPSPLPGPPASTGPSTAAPSSTTLAPSPPAPAPPGFRVVEAFLRADPFEHQGACPAAIRFSGRISVAGGGGTVTYRLVRSDGASPLVKTLRFEGPGSLEISETWARGEGSGWEQIEILDPHPLRSAQATFTITCT